MSPSSFNLLFWFPSESLAFLLSNLGCSFVLSIFVASQWEEREADTSATACSFSTQRKNKKPILATKMKEGRWCSYYKCQADQKNNADEENGTTRREPLHFERSSTGPRQRNGGRRGKPKLDIISRLLSRCLKLGRVLPTHRG